jgi:RimJ/RimL family protein N-acetyltransferase|uniref:GNAT family N-acetyltransferase n=1 Tax=Paractinoplanes polyasparticus TaxID=2856853 RepID=UPI001C864079|nr:GNAT family protein [Actinoplanes polyasparticus]
MDAYGDKVRLRALGVADAEALWRWNHDADVMRWMDEGYAETTAQVAKWLEERAANAYGDVLFGVEEPGGTLIGLVRLHGAEPETGVADLDVYLGEKDFWGKGYGTDAVRTVCRYGFEKMRLRKITLTAVVENEPAVHIYRKVGFVEEGRLRQVFRRDGEWIDKFTMGLLANELR